MRKHFAILPSNISPCQFIIFSIFPDEVLRLRTDDNYDKTQKTHGNIGDMTLSVCILLFIFTRFQSQSGMESGLFVKDLQKIWKSSSYV